MRWKFQFLHLQFNEKIINWHPLPSAPSAHFSLKGHTPPHHLDPRTPTLEETFTELCGFTISPKRWSDDDVNVLETLMFGALVCWIFVWLLPKHPKKGSIKLDAFQIVATQKQEPSLCGSSFSGFLFNRRKEVWLYDLVAKSCKFTVMNKDLFLKIDRYGCHWLPWTATRMASWEGSQAELEFEDSNRARLSQLSDGFNEMI